MALGPNSQVLNSHDTYWAEYFEAQIDIQMKFRGFDENGDFFCQVSGDADEIVINEVVRRYKAKGWSSVEFVRTGYRWKFKK